jgi:hypothetical protein
LTIFIVLVPPDLPIGSPNEITIRSPSCTQLLALWRSAFLNAGGQLPDAVDHGKRSGSVSQQDRPAAFARRLIE